MKTALPCRPPWLHTCVEDAALPYCDIFIHYLARWWAVSASGTSAIIGVWIKYEGLLRCFSFHCSSGHFFYIFNVWFRWYCRPSFMTWASFHRLRLIHRYKHIMGSKHATIFRHYERPFSDVHTIVKATHTTLRLGQIGTLTAYYALHGCPANKTSVTRDCQWANQGWLCYVGDVLARQRIMQLSVAMWLNVSVYFLLLLTLTLVSILRSLRGLNIFAIFMNQKCRGKMLFHY